MSITANDVIIWGRQPDSVGGRSRDNSVGVFTASGSGAANGTTIVSTELGSYGDSDDDFVGKWVEVVYATNAPGKESGAGICKRIVANDDGTSTITVDDLGFQTADGDRFKLLSDPRPYIVEDTGGSATQIVDSDRDEADDTHNGRAIRGGPYVVPIKTGSIATTEVRRVSDWSSATNRLTVPTAFSASTDVGDLFDIAEFPQVQGGPLQSKQGLIELGVITGTTGQVQSVTGLREGGGTVELMFRGPGPDNIGDEAEAHTPLSCVLDASSISDCTVDAAASVSSIPTSVGSPAEGEMFVTANGDVCVAESVAGTTITPSPNLRTAPASGGTLHGVQKYAPSTDVNFAMWIQQWLGKGIRDELWGCVPNISFSFGRGEPCKLSLDFVSADSERTVTGYDAAALNRAWRALQSTQAPVRSADCRVVIGGTECEARSVQGALNFELTPNVNMAEHNGHSGYTLINGGAPTLTVELYDGTDARLLIERFRGNEALTVLCQNGFGPGAPGIFAFWAYRMQITDDEVGEDAGRRTVSIPLKVIEHETELTLPRYMVGIA